MEEVKRPTKEDMAKAIRKVREIRGTVEGLGDGQTKAEVDNLTLADAKVRVTTKGGKQAEVRVVGEKVEVTGEQKHEVEAAISAGGKISTIENGLSEAQKTAIENIKNSNLSEAKKKKMEQSVINHDFSKDTQTPEEYTQQVSQEVKKEEEKVPPSSKKQPNPMKSALQKIMGHRGIAETAKPRKPTGKNFALGLAAARKTISKIAGH